MPGGGGALATVHSGQSQAATGQHVGSALLQPGLTCTGRTEAVLSSGARHRIWANFDRRHSSPRARSDKMLTVWKLRLTERKRLPCERELAGSSWTAARVFFGFFSDSTVYGTFVYLHSASITGSDIRVHMWSLVSRDRTNALGTNEAAGTLYSGTRLVGARAAMRLVTT